ncbi:MAG: metal-dependent transcriptional regulator [Promethearchaeota archaeon]
MEKLIDELVAKELVKKENDQLSLLEEGEREARSVIRRHRLSERLFYDIIQLKEDIDACEGISCHFEHLIRPGPIEESVCTLLGHPKVCPHGKEIFSGPCCLRKQEVANSVVRKLTQLEPGERGIVSYITTRKHEILHKLSSFGIIPGVQIIMHRKFPSIVIMVDEMMIAFESDVGDAIYVRRI